MTLGEGMRRRLRSRHQRWLARFHRARGGQLYHRLLVASHALRGHQVCYHMLFRGPVHVDFRNRPGAFIENVIWNQPAAPTNASPYPYDFDLRA